VAGCIFYANELAAAGQGVEVYLTIGSGVMLAIIGVLSRVYFVQRKHLEQLRNELLDRPHDDLGAFDWPECQMSNTPPSDPSDESGRVGERRQSEGGDS
jgi:hypothetical protein